MVGASHVLSSEITGPAEEIGLYYWEKKCSVSLGEGQMQSPKYKTGGTANSVSHSVRSDQDKAAPPALSTLQEGFRGQDTPGPEGPSVQQRQNRSMWWKPTPAPPGLERGSSGALRFQQCGGRAMCRLVYSQRVPCFCPQSLKHFTVPRNEPCCPCSLKAALCS